MDERRKWKKRGKASPFIVDVAASLKPYVQVAGEDSNLEESTVEFACK